MTPPRPLSFLFSDAGGLSVSLAAHLLAIVLFSVSFQSRAPEPQPVFVFLGSILDSQEIARLGQIMTTQPASSTDLKDLTGRSLGDLSPTTKPALAPGASSRKIDIKPAQQLSDSGREASEAEAKLLQELGIDPQPPQQAPYRLILP